MPTGESASQGVERAATSRWTVASFTLVWLSPGRSGPLRGGIDARVLITLVPNVAGPVSAGLSCWAVRR
jgi:hypothetical protein